MHMTKVITISLSIASSSLLYLEKSFLSTRIRMITMNPVNKTTFIHGLRLFELKFDSIFEIESKI